ncbi:MAG: FKBP-type peptidyl-prolyl cis-trans isomerase [Akkermansiaceae bacterium]|jgi:peptidylprolyl isomerase
MTLHKPLALFSALAFASCSQKIKEAPKSAPLPAGVTQTYTGLKSKVLRPGLGGRTPNSLSTVTAHYSGMTLDGKVFDSSYKRGKPSEFPLDQVIAGWTEGLQLMTKGEKRRFWIPANLAYGENPSGGKPGGDLIFDVELIDFRQ